MAADVLAPTEAVSSSSPPVSDDSGVEMRTRSSGGEGGVCERRNKRKSSEPKRRKDVLLMKRFRWEEDEDSEEDKALPLKKEEEQESSHRTTASATTTTTRTSSGATRTSGTHYKGMSPQRRMEANARERSRVHTIGAAFESLRRCVPAYAHNQKLSKLAVLRIASAYIVALACLNDNREDTEDMSSCVDRCTRTIQAEGRSRRRSKD